MISGRGWPDCEWLHGKRASTEKVRGMEEGERVGERTNREGRRKV
jgi:hypothetical protein